MIESNQVNRKGITYELGVKIGIYKTIGIYVNLVRIQLLPNNTSIGHHTIKVFSYTLLEFCFDTKWVNLSWSQLCQSACQENVWKTRTLNANKFSNVFRDSWNLAWYGLQFLWFFGSFWRFPEKRLNTALMLEYILEWMQVNRDPFCDLFQEPFDGYFCCWKSSIQG